ncbi:MAG: multicopper oxidase domain-containing protein [Candidatus Nanohaloarchaea archaeon]
MKGSGNSLILLTALALLMVTSAAGHATSQGGGPPPAYQPAPPSLNTTLPEPEEFCQTDKPSWRKQQSVYGVLIQESLRCSPDQPRLVAAVVKGTNNVPMSALRKTGLSRDAVRKGRDLDGDGDPDVINMTLEVAEINGWSGSSGLSASQEIAPGVTPPMWVFAPKTRGMATEGAAASDVIRAPSPAIRVEKGDRVRVTLENTHYMPHTIHFHGVDHPYMRNGTGMDGVPQTSGEPVSPGEAKTYRFSPSQAGTMFYHCHVQPNIHVLMGLQGMFIITKERDNNTVQTFNVGNGKVRHPSEAVEGRYASSYDYLYQGVDIQLHNIVNISNDPRVISKTMNRRYDVTEREPDYFLLNGKSFPYTIRESNIVVEKNQRVKLRILNAGSESISVHTHGHKPTITHYDGVKAPEGKRIQRDVFSISAAQRLDLVINTTEDGLNSYGPGVWFVHDHKEEAVTTNGIAPGGDISLIVYEKYLKKNGFPETHGVSWEKYFTEEYYNRKVPVWKGYEKSVFFGEIKLRPAPVWPMIISSFLGVLAGLGLTWRLVL